MKNDAFQTLSQDSQIRHLTPDDLTDLAHLFIAYELAVFGTSEQSEERVRADWRNTSTFHLETDSWGVFTSDGKLVAAAAVEIEGYINYYPLACVHPDYSGRGIGTYLLHMMEQWIIDHLPLSPHNVRIISFVGTSHKNLAAQQLFEHEGYQLIRRFWRMQIEMDEPPQQPTLAEGITIRPYIVGQDDHAVFEMIEEAFQDHWEHLPSTFEEWEEGQLKQYNFDPTLWYLACDGSRIVGGALCRYREKIGWVGRLAVLRPWRHKGVGMALLLHAFNEFYHRGTRQVELVVDSENLTGAVRLYERAGMHVAQENIAYQKVMRAGKS